MKQEEAFSLLKMGKNIFLTGAAGSGKTYLLNQYIRYLKEHHIKVAVTASTGIAATHLEGTTIHSWSGMGIRDQLSQKDLEKLATTDRVKRNLKKTKVLIIDEISMLHPHQLDMVDVIARHILGCDTAFGGIQVVLCGDFFQLPPISPSSSLWGKSFAYESSAWKNGDFHVCYLSEQHRQGDDVLLTILNDIRYGKAGEHTKVPLRTRYKKEPEGAVKATKLYSRNINVDAINEKELNQLEGKEKTFTMTTRGFHKIVEGLKKTNLALEKLKLKIGAEVMFIKNDPVGRYVNGTRGVVVNFDRSNAAWPIVKTYDHKIIIADAAEWKYEDNGMVHAVLAQVPLRLAWAITIHKSQGMTLDAAEIDLGDAFEPGMGYVSLSRVRSLSGLKLMNLNEMALKVNPKILEQDPVFKTQSDEAAQSLQLLSAEEQLETHQFVLSGRFGGGVKKSTRQKIAKVKKEKVLTHITTLEMLKQQLPLEKIAATRGLSIGTVTGHLEKLKGLELIDYSMIAYLKKTVSQEDFELISTEIHQSEDGKLAPIYEKFGGKYSYAHLRLVRVLVGFLLGQITSENIHSEIDTGSPTGKEIW